MQKNKRSVEKFALVHTESVKALKIVDKLRNIFTSHEPNCADVIIVIGGDGELLHAMHKYMHLGIPFYGINCGSIGFLMNEFDANNIKSNIETSVEAKLHVLEMIAEDCNGTITKALAINEVSIFRKTSQAANIQIIVDGIERMPKLVSDGVMIATPAGSSAYNLSAGGHIVPLESNILCLTPVSPFRPRDWRGALLKSSCNIKFNILDYDKRKVSAVADFKEIENVKSVSIRSVNNKCIHLLFDKNHSFEDRIIKEQFYMLP